MTTSRFDPMRELSNVRDQINRVFEETFSTNSLSIPFDVYHTESDVVVVSGAVQGLKLDTLDISIEEGNILVITGETVAPESPADAQYIRKERRFGQFSRRISVPVPVVADETRAQFKNHVLTITMPKLAPSNPRVVKITPVE